MARMPTINIGSMLIALVMIAIVVNCLVWGHCYPLSPPTQTDPLASRRLTVARLYAKTTMRDSHLPWSKAGHKATPSA